MSVQALGWVLDWSPTKGAERLCLLAIANHADERWEAYPSLETIAREANVTVDTARRSVRSLVRAGLLARAVNGAPDARLRPDRRPNLYRIVVEAREGERRPPATGTGGRTARRREGDPRVNGRARIAPLTTTEPSIEPSRALDGFDAWWQTYPRKVAKPAAQRAWRSALERADAATIAAGLAPWLTYWQARAEPQFVPYPATWLTGDRWADPAPTATRSGAAALDVLDRLEATS